MGSSLRDTEGFEAIKNRLRLKDELITGIGSKGASVYGSDNWMSIKKADTEELKKWFLAQYQDRFSVLPILTDEDIGVFSFLEKQSGKNTALELITHFFKMKRESFETYGYTPRTMRMHIASINEDMAKKKNSKVDTNSTWVKFMFFCRCKKAFEVVCRAVAHEMERDHRCSECLAIGV